MRLALLIIWLFLADDGTEPKFCIHIFMYGYWDISISFTDQIDCHVSIAIDTIVLMINFVNPVLACTDPNTDIGEVIVNGDFGWWCESDNVKRFCKLIQAFLECPESELKEMSKKEFQYLLNDFSIEKAYKTIMKNLH